MLAGTSSSTKKATTSPKLSALNFGKLILCKRLCQRVSDIPEDNVELRLLYGQAVHYVVHVSASNIDLSHQF